ncbi:MAG: DUF3800 domain-containing protein [Verrucomicrobiales bacterium]|nr:DUF3800 domain-containing protein [Verrucomicrobiales bacterium]
MYLLYVDESGHTADPHQNYFILAGVAVFERQGWWIANELDQIAARFDPANPNEVELHGSPMLQGRGVWKQHGRAIREQAMKDALSALTVSHPSNRLFATVVRKSAISPQDPVEYAFEQTASRFDRYLGRLHKRGDTQRGLILFDKSSHEVSLQKLAHNFRTLGHQWGILRNLSEVPVFIDSRASRLIQLADLVAFSLFRMWEKQDDRFYTIIRDRFDREGSIVHGLHVTD